MNEKQTLRDTLNVINEWTSNCDVKVSIILAIFGVVFSAFFSSDYVKIFIKIIKKCFDDVSLFEWIYIIALLAILLAIIIGFWKLIRVLLPTINTDKESLMFFGGISKYKTPDEYYNKVKNYSDDKVCEDLIYQIYAAAKICTQKFKNQKIGLYCLTFGSFIFVIWCVIGCFVFYM